MSRQILCRFSFSPDNMGYCVDFDSQNIELIVSFFTNKDENYLLNVQQKLADHFEDNDISTCDCSGGDDELYFDLVDLDDNYSICVNKIMTAWEHFNNNLL